MSLVKQSDGTTLILLFPLSFAKFVKPLERNLLSIYINK